ncbi:MAG: hypothetical protein J2P38_10990 [Candidatus Dormibacteraeota bacterium]|nr:hypothetical protein [Candidatus Dormibacteraeota bacterium]
MAASASPATTAARGRIRAAIRLVEAAAGDADLGSVTPSAIASAIREARRALGPVTGAAAEEASRLLREALETVEDGLPPDVTEALLDRASHLLR